jgi:thiamine-monophosphate kinase
VAARVPDRRGDDAGDVSERVLDAPEASGGERRELVAAGRRERRAVAGVPGVRADVGGAGRGGGLRLGRAVRRDVGRAVRAAAALGVSAIDLALYGGEDYALVAASAVPLAGFRRIGEVREGRGITLRTARGEHAIDPVGFDHFVPGARG